MTGQRNILGTIGPRFDAAIVTDALLSGDGTYSLTGQRYTGAGILVAIPEYGTKVRNASADWVAGWVSYAADAILSHPAPFYRPRYFGSWVDSATGTLYLDVVEVFSREEIAEAIAAGRDRNQIAIWDAGRQELIETGGTGE